MSCRPTSKESLEALRQLRQRTAEQGDNCLSVVLAGVELYTSLGREFDLLEVMRKFAEEMREAVQGTPTAKELEELFYRPEPE